jgi:parallel beta-helix repeat protein
MKSRSNARNGLVAVFVLFFAVVACAKVLEVPASFPALNEALRQTRNGDTIMVGAGIYRGNFSVPPRVVLVAVQPLKAELNGNSRGNVVTLSNGSGLVGFVVTNGTVGVFSNGSGASVASCRITNNLQSGVVCVRNMLQLTDNTIVFNGGSGIQTWDARSQKGSITHNTIAYNANHGISIGGSAGFIIENNIIAFNERFGVNQLRPQEPVTIINNNMFANLVSSAKLPPDNFSYDPAFVSPRKQLDFSEGPNVCCRHRGSDNEILGARSAAK